MAEPVKLPEGKEPVLRVMPMPADANHHGDIFGGWIMSQVDIAGGVLAGQHARGRVATVAVNAFQFKQPVQIGDLVSFYAEIVRVGNTSITVNVEVYAQRNPGGHRDRQGDRGDAHLRRDRQEPPAAHGTAPAGKKIDSLSVHRAFARRAACRRARQFSMMLLSL